MEKSLVYSEPKPERRRMNTRADDRFLLRLAVKYLSYAATFYAAGYVFF